MVIGYLDLFVFEEFVLALRPVVDGSDCVIQADPGIVVPDEIYRGQYFTSCTEQYFHRVRTSIFRTSWQAQYFRNNWLTACCSIDSVPTPLFFHESWQGPGRAQNSIITYHSGCYNYPQPHRHLPTCSGFSSRKKRSLHLS